MPLYRCRTSDARGKIRELELQARTEDILIRDLSSQGFFLIAVRRIEESPGGVGRGKKVGRGAVLEFTDSLAMMLSSGISLKDAVKVIAFSVSGRDALLLARGISEGISKGKSFSDSLEPFSRSFSTVYRGLVSIGERIGSIEDVIRRLSLYLHEDKKIRDRAANALVYPALVLGAMILGMAFVVLTILPRMREMFSQFGSDSVERIDASIAAMNGLFTGTAVLLCLLALAVFVALVLRKRGGVPARRIDRIMYGIPVVGRYLFGRTVMNFAFAMEILTGSGIPVEDSLREASRGLSGSMLRDEIGRIRQAVLRGDHLSAAFREGGVFPERISVWIAIGEQTGQVDKVFAQIRQTYQAEIENWSARFMTLVEPAIILIVGALLLFLVLAFIVPLFSMFGSLL